MNLIYDISERVATHWVAFGGFFHLLISVPAAMHVLLYKENQRTALAWIGLVLLSPYLGSLIYWFFGINRIKRQAKRAIAPLQPLATSEKQQFPLMGHDKWQPVMKAGYALHKLDYIANNQVIPLINGDAAYPKMLEAINQAESFVYLSSYIFDYDELGLKFIEALANAKDRGVNVRVLIDGIGVRYSWRKSDKALSKRGVTTARFLPANSFKGIRFINLRNHRKILSIDGRIAYVGGMNISQDNVVALTPIKAVHDIHFELRGPIIDQVSHVFIEDWYYAKRERLPVKQARLANNISTGSEIGSVIARVIQDGPDHTYDRIHWTLINAFNSAQQHIRIVTPYFLPDQVLASALLAAALRGVEVEIVVPRKSNFAFFDWAMNASLKKYCRFGIKIFRNFCFFDHSKVVVIDNDWCFIGSANLDARSLEFNFEINVECFDVGLAKKMTKIFIEKRDNSVEITEYDMNNQSIFSTIRDRLFGLFSSYL